MKTYRILVVVLSLLVLCLAYLALSGHRNAAGEQVKEMWYTNTVELWRTNIVELWRTNTMEVSVTKTLMQPFTNEVVKEVPARLSAAERRAALVGYKYLNAPSLSDGSDTLYKAGPLAVDVSVLPNVPKVLQADADALKKQIELALNSRSIPVDGKSPSHLSLAVAPVWATDMPRVALLRFRLELREQAASERQGDIVDCGAVVWSTEKSKLVRTAVTSEDVKDSVQEEVDKFCQDFLKAKEAEKTVESRLPAIPADFLSEGR